MAITIDRPYLSGYANDIMAIKDGPFLLGNMIAKAETRGELQNYNAEHIVAATVGLMDHTTVHYFDDFLKSVSRDSERLWPVVESAYQNHFDTAMRRALDDKDTISIDRLNKVAEVFNIRDDIVKRGSAGNPVPPQPNYP